LITVGNFPFLGCTVAELLVQVNRPGFGHVAFEVEGVRKARQVVEPYGGGAVDEIVTLTTKV